MLNIDISIIVCAYNEEDSLEKCLFSIKHQIIKQNVELIIIDNSSLDWTGEIAKKFIDNNYSEIKAKYIKIKHVSLSLSRNTGIKESNGDIIIFIDADAYADNQWLSNLLKGFYVGNADVVSGRVENGNNESWYAKFIHRVHFRPMILAGKSKLIGANMGFRRSVFESIGVFSPIIKGRGDETFVVTNYFLKYPDRKEYHAEDAIIYNKHAEQAIEWLKQQIQEGRGFISILRLNNQMNTLHWVKNILRFFNIAFWLCTIPFIFFGLYKELLIFSCFAIIRNVARYKYLYFSFKNAKKFYGVLSFFGSLLNSLAGTFCIDLGCIIELFHTDRNMESNNSIASGEIIEVYE